MNEEQQQQIELTPNWEQMKPEEKIPIFLASLPHQRLKKLAKTEDLLEFWRQLREHNEVVGACLRARFSGGDDPIADWKKDKLGELCHNFIWSNVDAFQALWNLIQMSTGAVKKEFEKTGSDFPLNGAYDLFLQIVGTGRDNEFESALHYQKISTQETAELWKLIRKAAWGTLNTKEIEKVKQLTKFELKNFWLEFTFGVCKVKSKSDTQIANKLADYRREVGRLADAHHALISNSQKGRVPLKLPSYEWHNGQKKYAKRYGGTYS
ncbi:hypothetical protein [Allocoleopsis sp.]|uniref:hypothetical protein n=1 Tax=Allocoleopsis sp. TaxID=3088169 RepID=UPI002FD13E77